MNKTEKIDEMQEQETARPISVFLGSVIVARFITGILAVFIDILIQSF